MTEIQDGDAGLKNGGGEGFGHGDFCSLTEWAKRQEEIIQAWLNLIAVFLEPDGQRLGNDVLLGEWVNLFYFPL